MADISVKCPGCGKEVKISEYVSASSVMCPSCKREVSVPASARTSRLQVRRPKERDLETLKGEKVVDRLAVDATAATQAAQMGNVLRDVHKAREKVSGPHVIWAWVPFVVMAGGMIWWQHWMKGDPELIRVYGWVRSGALAFISLLVFVSAFEESLLQGSLSILLYPFYTSYYAFVRMEYYWLRGLFAAMMIVLLSELYFLRQYALLVAFQNGLNNMIETVSGLIQRASEPPLP